MLDPEKFFQAHEDLVVGTVTPDAQYVLQLEQLFDHLLKAIVGMDEEPDAAVRAATDRHTEDALYIEGAA
jgi:hypothetical protein